MEAGGWRRRRGDLAAALGLTVVGIAEATFELTSDGSRWAALTVPLVTLSLLVRATRPGAALAVVLLVQVAQSAAGSDLPGGFVEPLVLLVLVYTLAAHRDLRSAAAWLVVAAFGAACVVTAGGDVRATNYVFAMTMVAAAWVGGRGVRLADERRGLLAERQLMQERTRIARELHDVVAHGVSGIVVQAGAERRAAPAGSEVATTLQEIEQRGRETLTELRRLLGVLRVDPESEAPLTPQPGLPDLPALLDSVGAAGLTASLTESGERDGVREAVGLVVYRVVQEGLTNVVKHSSADHAEVGLHWSPGAVEVEVRDRGRSRAVAAVPGSGFGLRSIADRVQAYGGQVLHAGPCEDGFRVRVRIPTGEAP